MNVTKHTPEEMIVQHAGTCPVSNDCKSCGKCCQYGTGYLIDSDMPKIAAFLGVTEEELKEKYLEQVEKFHKNMWKPKTTKKHPQDNRARTLSMTIMVGEKSWYRKHDMEGPNSGSAASR